MNPKVLITKLDESNLQMQQREATVDEIEVSDFVAIMRASFNIFSEPVQVDQIMFGSLDRHTMPRIRIAVVNKYQLMRGARRCALSLF